MRRDAALFVSSRQGIPSASNSGVKYSGFEPRNNIPFALCADASGLRNLVGFLVNIVDRRNVAAFLNDLLQRFQNAGKQHILGAFHNQCDPIVGLLLQMLGVGVRFIIVAVYDFQYFLTGFCTDAGGVI